MRLPRPIALSVLLGVAGLAASAGELFPLSEVRAGMKGTGRTVFQGREIEEFRVEILGVLENVGPKQSIILARLAGGPLAETGVMAGMSGSPVFLDGKLAGAIAFTFPFSKEPITGIRPIEEMIASQRNGRVRSPSSEAAAAMLFRDDHGEQTVELFSAELRAPIAPIFSGEPQLVPIATPVNLAGFSQRTLDLFGSRLRQLGLKPAQGTAAGGRTDDADPSEAATEPGAMISVALIRGDLEVSAAGTVTHVDGDRLYAFGHPFLSSGPTELPFLAAEVIALVPNLNNSFKIAGSGSLLGTIISDSSAGLTGIVGKTPALTPVRLRVTSGQNAADYAFEIVRDPLLTPYLLQMALFSSIDATQRQVGASTLRLRGEARFGENIPPLRLDNIYSAPTNTALSAAATTSLMLYYVLLNANIAAEGINLTIEASDREEWAEIDRVWSDKRKVRPGETIELSAALKDADGNERIEKLHYRVPAGTPAGVMHLTFADADTVNLMEWQTFLGLRRAKDPAQLVATLNRLRRNDRLYLRVWRPQPAFRLNAESLPSPPASVAAVLGSAPSGGSLAQAWRSVSAELEADPGLGVLHGDVTMQISVTP